MTIKDKIEEWLKNEDRDNYVEYKDFSQVTLDGIFDLEELQSKLIHHIIEIIDEIPVQGQLLKNGIDAGTIYLINREAIKQKLLQEIGESK